MYYVEVWVADLGYHGDEALTYSHTQPIEVGSIVSVPLRAKSVMGIVVKLSNTKPPFRVKPVTQAPVIPALPAALLKLQAWMRQYYPSPSGVITQQFLPKQLPKKPLTNSPDIGELRQAQDLPPLTAEQASVLKAVDATGAYLLHGETGTGKTRVYIELTQKTIAEGRSAIVLTPEIGLTSQLARDFRMIFGEQVIILHSQLTSATRERLWLSLLERETPSIIIGPRSALFAPLKSVGLIILDEAHETAYKQDQSPYYHATKVASKLADIHNARLILGSATPLVTDYFLAEAKGRPILRMEKTARNDRSTHKEVLVIDLKDRTQFTKSPYLSSALLTALKATLERGEQSLLFLNRRGTACVVFCERCGWQVACPHCDLPMVYHGDSHRMRCHSCNFSSACPTSCPECHNASIVFKSIGTKAIVDEVRRLFPDIKVLRFDTDNKKSERIEEHYDDIKAGNVDIIVGTQTLAKGLDLPYLSLVGVIIADTSLFFPDFSAQERTYQLLGQVLGRVGRGHRDSTVVLQTYSPDTPLLQSILQKDWQTFYSNELLERKTFLFPPYCYLLKLTCRRASSKAAETAASQLGEVLKHSGLRIIIEGPTPAFQEKILNKYQWQLIIKAKDRRQLIEVIALLPHGWSHDIDPMNLL